MSMSENDRNRPADKAEAEKAETEPPATDDTPAGPEQRVAALEAEVADLRDRLLREMAEMENVRKRARRETEDAGRYAIARFARDLVTVADDLRRALAAVPAEARSGTDDALGALIKGFEVTERSFEQILERHGITRFEPAGEKFDPQRHEAMFEVPDESVPANTVARVVEAGYTIGDRVLRPARVGVSKGGPKAAPAADPVSTAADDPGAEAEAAEPAQRSDPQRIGIKIDKSA